MDSLREDLKNIIRNNLHLEFKNHQALCDPTQFEATLKIVEHHLDKVVSELLDRINLVS